MPVCRAMDIETTVAPWFGRKASPFHPDNWIVAAAWTPANKLERPEVHGSYWTEPGQSNGWLVPILGAGSADPLKYLAGFNIKFDLLHLLRDPENYAAYMQWVADGGLVWDCQLAEYLLGGMAQEHQTLSLEEVSLRYGGTLKHDAVKDLWDQGYDTPAIPKDLLMRYLCGDPADYDEPDRIDGDAINTIRIFKAQYMQAKALGMLPLMEANMGALMATIEMEKNGLHVDKEKGLELAGLLEIEIGKLREGLQQFLPKDLPFEFNWGSTRQKSAIIFGGEIPYERREYDRKDGSKTWTPPEDGTRDQYLYAQKEEKHYVMADGTLWPHGPSAEPGRKPLFEYTFYASGLKKGEVKTKNVKTDDYTKPKSRMATDVWKFPRQVVPKPQWAGAEPGTYSTSADVIEDLTLSNSLPFLEALDTLVKAVKDLGTYYQTVDEAGKAKGMLTKVQQDGLIHHTLHMVRTITARLSSADPNLQNLPRAEQPDGKYTSKVKHMFTSRFPGGSSISSDFTALEVYCQAYLTKDKQLIADLMAGLDMHCARLSTVESIPYEECVRLCKIDKVGEWPAKRTGIKIYSFQRAYGAGATKIAGFLRIDKGQVEIWMKADDARYPGIPQWFRDMEATVKASKKPTNKFILHPITKESVRVWRGYWTDMLGKTYTFEEGAVPEFVFKKDGTLMGFTPTELKNYPTQGLGGEIMKVAMWLALRAFYKVKNFGGLALLVNTVHDALYSDAHPTVRMKAAALLHACMAEACAHLEQHYNIKLPLPVPSETTAGPSMADEESIEGLKEAAAKAQAWVRSNLCNNYIPSWEKAQNHG